MSRKFKFGLERVRELREHAEAQAKEQLAASLNQRLRGAAMLAAATERLNEATAATPSQPGAVISGADLAAHAIWLQQLRLQRETAELHLGRLDTDVAARRAALGEARRRREVLERLKERRHQEHMTAAQKREDAELDEIANAARARRGREDATAGGLA